MSKVKNILKSRYILGFICGTILFGMTVLAVNLIAGDITYDNKTSKMNSTNIQDAIDELYVKARGCPQKNSNIVKVMKYSTETSDKCITGEEATCEEITHGRTVTYTPGTIVKYKVNSSTTRTFYVLHDDGEQLTLQDRENLVNEIKWYASSNDNTHGPLTALEALETATSNWSNVVSQTYTMGTTNFNGTNSYTGCDTNLSCTTNMYTLASRTAKARIITLQETIVLGCEVYTEQLCPIWMNNYLEHATSYGGTNTGEDYGYWTMSTNESASPYAWLVGYAGIVYLSYVDYISFGVRPVIVINK